jgi:hypothetical protein
MKIKYLLLIFFVLMVGCSTPVNKHYNSANPCYPDVAKEFLRWNKAKGKELKGLTNRRQQEYKFFMKGCPDC